MQTIRRCKTCFLVFWLFAAATLFGGTTGKITGRVYDKATGDPLPGVNVVVVGTTMGAATDLKGNFIIINVPPGTYSLRASFIGFKNMIVSNVRVSVDLTTEIDFALEETVLELGETVEVVAERPLVQKDLTASTAVVGSEIIAELPVTEVSEVLELQAGYVAGHVRGGRSGEVAYWIDGIPVTDVYDGSTVVDVNKSTVQELQLVSGAYNAEYGQAMSGIINIVTKDGDNQFSAELSGYLGDFISDEDRKKDVDGTETTLFDGIEEIDPVAIRNTELSVSGALIHDKLFFFTNGRYYYNEGYLYGRHVFNPGNITDNTDPDPAKWIISINPEVGRGDSSLVAMDTFRRYYFQNKLTWRIAPGMKLAYNFIGDWVKDKNFNFAFKFNPLGLPTNFRTGMTHLVNLNHVLSNSTFYQLGLSFFDKEFKSYVFEDPHDPGYVHPLLLGQNPPYSFLTGGMDLGRFKRQTQTLIAKLDLTSQITGTHQVKGGIEFRSHEVSSEFVGLQPAPEDQNRIPAQDGDPFISTIILDERSTATERYKHKPLEFSAYLQDKMEFKDLIVNVGLRFDMFDPDGVVLSDPTDNNIYAPRRPENRFRDLNDNGIQDPGEPEITVEERRAYWFKDASVKTQLSPRLGVAFPITDRGVIHFSYGYFFQIPPFNLLYQNSDFELGVGTGNVGLLGNADLKPQQTVNGEIGLQQQLSEDISIDITGYFRDIRDLAGTRSEQIRLFGAGFYDKLVNSDFGFVRGIVITLEKRLRDNFAATIDYTLQTAKGNASDPAETRNALLGGREPETQLIPLNWDQTHTLNVTTTYSDPKNWGISLITQYGSGLPYTPRVSEDIGILLTNSERRPAFFNADLRAFKNFHAGAFDFTAFLRVFNIFDRRNQLGVYDDTGRADYTLDELRARQQNPVQLVNSIGQFFRNPSFYSEPRRVEIGFSVTY